jgi:pilus assembly protein CpaB
VIADQANRTARAAAAVVTGGSGPMEQLYGSIVRDPILANEPVTNAKLVRGGEGGYMAVVLQPGMRAISVQVNAMTAAGGFILPGDRVDVLQSRPADANANANANARTIPVFLLRNIRVLAIDQNSQAPKNGQQSQVGATATIEVAATDTEVIARAKDVILALRPYSDAGGPAGRASDAQDTGQVRIFRGGQAAEVVTIQ